MAGQEGHANLTFSFLCGERLLVMVENVAKQLRMWQDQVCVPELRLSV